MIKLFGRKKKYVTPHELFIDEFLYWAVRGVNYMYDWELLTGKINNLRYINRDIIFLFLLS